MECVCQFMQKQAGMEVVFVFSHDSRVQRMSLVVTEETHCATEE